MPRAARNATGGSSAGGGVGLMTGPGNARRQRDAGVGRGNRPERRAEGGVVGLTTGPGNARRQRDAGVGRGESTRTPSRRRRRRADDRPRQLTSPSAT